MSDKTIAPDRSFDPTKETQEEYEFSAVFPIIELNLSQGTISVLKGDKQQLKPYPGDRGDEAVVGDLYKK